MSRGGGTGKYKLVGGDFPTAALGGVKTQPGDFSPDKENDATAAVAFPFYVCKKKKERDQMATARKRDQRQVARMEKEHARKRHRQNVAKEKARPKRSGPVCLRLKGTTHGSACIPGLAELFNGFGSPQELNLQSVLDLVMEEEVTLEHKFVHVADFRFAG